eukprot:406451-Hanusia_phi.AAC.1
MGTGGATEQKEGKTISLSPTNVEIPLLLYSSKSIRALKEVLEAILRSVPSKEIPSETVLVLMHTILKEAACKSNWFLTQDLHAQLREMLRMQEGIQQAAAFLGNEFLQILDDGQDELSPDYVSSLVFGMTREDLSEARS